jgi:alpha-mannosidase
LLPHSDGLRHVIDQAYSLNVPLLVRDLKPAEGSLPASHSFFLTDRPDAVVDTIKVAEEGGAIIVRLYESEGGRGPLTLTTTLPVRKAWLVNLLETEEKSLPIKSGSIRLDLRPFEIVTLKYAL